jgi:hypothetical protein
MCAPTFGLSTTPVEDVKSELRLQLERDLLHLEQIGDRLQKLGCYWERYCGATRGRRGNAPRSWK